jgi:DNA-binding MarR family transcriptional regulator
MVELFGGTPRTIGDLGNKLAMDTGTIIPLLKRLEKAGFITRQRGVADERRVLIDLTEAGEAVRNQVWRIPEQIKSACRLTDDGLAALRDTIDDLTRPAQG